MPAVAPPPAAAAIAATVPTAPAIEASASALDARAEIKPIVQPAPTPKRPARAHRRNPRPAPNAWAAANPTAREWSWNW
ncbi:MAG: hypothetical protein JOZ74_14165 [Bradyrhizobium sp.]|nr:hypothetical protein [Bradyrhizobium sp.]